MSNEFFNSSGYPAFDSNGDSASARSEFVAIQTGFDKLPVLTGAAGLLVRVNAAGTALEAIPLTSANIQAAISDETGTGALVFANTPTLVTPILGTPTSGTLTNCSGLPAAGVVGTALVAAAIGTTVQAYDADLTTWAGVTPGTGVTTALAIAVGSAGAPVVLNGALGTPSSGTVTNLTGTANININGTVGATTPTTGAFTTVNGHTLTAGSSTFTGTAAQTYTFPSATSTLASLALAETLTNKTLTSPVINGTVTTTGLTLPATTFSGAITSGTNGTFTATGTGFSGTAPTATATYKICNGVCTITIPTRSMTGTSNATTFTITGLPSICFPSADRFLTIAAGLDNGAITSQIQIIITASGGILLYQSGGNWTSSGDKWLDTSEFTYIL